MNVPSYKQRKEKKKEKSEKVENMDKLVDPSSVSILGAATADNHMEQMDTSNHQLLQILEENSRNSMNFWLHQTGILDSQG